MISGIKEDYIKLIYKLTLGGEPASNKDIAAALKVSAATVTDMLRRLEKEGYIVYEPYKGISLTALGEKSAVDTVTRHRLWEVFLCEKLGYDWADVHERAERLEHATDSGLTERLSEFLGFPKACPHGWAIPYGGKPPLRLKRLTEFEAGAKVTAESVKEEPELLIYLEKTGIKIGGNMTIEKFGEYGGNVTLDVGGTKKEISRKAAENIFCSSAEKKHKAIKFNNA